MICRLINDNNIKKVDLEIISKDIIKPSNPTLQHLRNFSLSIIDQLMYDVYTPLIFFFPNTDKGSVKEVITKRSKYLKETLSQILTQFYPLAGEIKDNSYIDCNDKGAYFVEARVNQMLEDFIRQPDDHKVRELIPETPSTTESSKGNYVMGIQVNIFSCGGIGLSTSFSHKIFDGQTYFMFMKAWAAAVRGSPEIISPSFVASEVFPKTHSLKYSLPSNLMTNEFLSTKRFVFDSTALARLKSKPISGATHGPTRMVATSAVIWKATVNTASALRTFTPQSPHALLSMVNIRKRASPPFANESFGNIVDTADAICFPNSQPDLATLTREVRESLAKKDSNHIETMKGEKGHGTFNEILSTLNHLTSVMDKRDFVFVSSLLNSGMYDLDFGWAKLIWFHYMNAGFTKTVSLHETLKGGGVEARVTMSPDEMDIFECDPELLSYAMVDPSPLQFLR
ncbi:transferase, Chloramphenicol acetyltransferase-like domain protein [Artemisia annua]|uniref:Transferase, Chloramphenicol acetyltransferase-like domain protein n=1 Tax=Artemisia annua TaxID=35608 RepID=A0A2U1L0R6_ARTAN|nr:transferase, Chloramphenicol acetyltransferase-like domain protein [Artemisia annua]